MARRWREQAETIGTASMQRMLDELSKENDELRKQLVTERRRSAQLDTPSGGWQERCRQLHDTLESVVKTAKRCTDLTTVASPSRFECYETFTQVLAVAGDVLEDHAMATEPPLPEAVKWVREQVAGSSALFLMAAGGDRELQQKLSEVLDWARTVLLTDHHRCLPPPLSRTLRMHLEAAIELAEEGAFGHLFIECEPECRCVICGFRAYLALSDQQRWDEIGHMVERSHGR